MIFNDLTVDIPKGALVSRSDNRVYLNLGNSINKESGKSVKVRISIGQYVSPGKMHPNDRFKEKYPELWKSYTGNAVETGTLKIGLYAAINSICQNNGMYDDLVRAYGETKAHAILDYCQFMIGFRSGSTEPMESYMHDKLTFTNGGVHSDSWYSDLFINEMPSELNEAFRESWLKRCTEAGIKDVYICVDGSNNDCDSEGVELAEKGHAKPHENTNVVSFMYAVDSITRTPVYCVEYRGGMVDSKAVKMIVDALAANHIKVKGFIIDKGFCTEECLKYLISHKIEYVLKLKKNTDGHRKMLEEYMYALKFNVLQYIPGTNYFGASREGKLFKNSEITATIHLYYDWKNGGERSITLLEKVYECKAQADKAIAAKETVSIPNDLKEYLVLETKRNRITGVSINAAALQVAVDGKGYSSLATSKKMDAIEADALYDLRMNSEVMYSQMKTQQGFDVSTAHRSRSVMSKYMVVFIASILRNEILQTCKKLRYSTNTAINELNLLEMKLRAGKVYDVIHTESKRQLALMDELDISGDELDAIAKNKSDKMNGIVKKQKRLKPGPKKGSHHTKYDEEGNIIKRKPGPKPGSHHKKKYNKDGSLRQKPGPKPGSKRKKKDESEATDN